MTQSVLMQRYVRGNGRERLLAGGRDSRGAVDDQCPASGGSPQLSYEGGRSPLDHPSAGKAIDAAVRTCDALPGLRGYVGVDVVLTASDAVVIEVNPRLTTAYLGVRSVVQRERGGAGDRGV